MYIHKF